MVLCGILLAFVVMQGQAVAAEKFKPHKMRVGYHNHTTDFNRIDGEYWWNKFADWTTHPNNPMRDEHIVSRGEEVGRLRQDDRPEGHVFHRGSRSEFSSAGADLDDPVGLGFGIRAQCSVGLDDVATPHLRGCGDSLSAGRSTWL